MESLGGFTGSAPMWFQRGHRNESTEECADQSPYVMFTSKKGKGRECQDNIAKNCIQIDY
jgi:hypothetical protein